MQCKHKTLLHICKRPLKRRNQLALLLTLGSLQRSSTKFLRLAKGPATAASSHLQWRSCYTAIISWGSYKNRASFQTLVYMGYMLPLSFSDTGAVLSEILSQPQLNLVGFDMKMILHHPLIRKLSFCCCCC